MSALREETVLSAHAQPDPAIHGMVVVRMIRCAEHLVTLSPGRSACQRPIPNPGSLIQSRIVLQALALGLARRSGAWD